MATQHHVRESGWDEERLQEALLTRAQEVVDAAAKIVARSEVLASVSTGEGLLRSRCAWCGRYRIGNTWVKVERNAMLEMAETTHGICEDCVTALREAGLSL